MLAILFTILIVHISGYTSQSQPPHTYVAQIPCPEGFERIEQDSKSFGAWLRLVKLNTNDNLVHLYDGSLKGNQQAQYAILTFDVGKQDLQQCADAVMRLRTEYLWANKRYSDIHFKFTNGFDANYLKYRNGNRIQVNGNKVNWVPGSADTSYNCLRKYLNMVFAYAGTWSLNKELMAVKNPADVQPGDVFIEARQPYGHAVMVMDVAKAPDGRICILLAQSYMPAQEIHILRNPIYSAVSPWFVVDTSTELITPEWTFKWEHLKRFP